MNGHVKRKTPNYNTVNDHEISTVLMESGFGQTLEIMQMRQCLASDRPDMEVSLWLQDIAEKRALEDLPQEVVYAYLADRYLVEVNSGGHEGFFSWQFKNVPATPGVLRALGLPALAELLQKAMHLVVGPVWPEDKDELDEQREALHDDEDLEDRLNALDDIAIDQSPAIEKATHAYIQKHIALFDALDQVRARGGTFRDP